MEKYIDADALLKIVLENHYLLRIANGNSTDYGMFTNGIRQAIDETPAAPVRREVHAAWVDDMYFDEPVTRCSNCRHGFAKGHKAERFKYCPECGARMDLDAKGAEANGNK